MADRRGVGIKRRKNICTEGRKVEGRDNLVISQCTGNRIWRKMEDNRISNKKLLVARSNERCWKICG